MFSKILLVVALIVGGAAALIATQPDQFHVKRSITVSASPENLFSQVNDFHTWAAWSPWEQLDPQMDKTFSGSPTGIGASYAWKSANRKVGEGHMTIEKSERPSLIGITLDVSKPFLATIQVTFKFDDLNESSGEPNDLAGRGSSHTTKVTWTMDGLNSFTAKAFSLVMNVEQMMGSDFERGLAALKTVAESMPKAKPAVVGAPVPH